MAAINKEKIRSYLPEKPIIFDCGAHIGQDSVEFAALWPESHIHAFEGVPFLVEHLRRNVAPFPNVTVVPTAVWDRTGSMKMHLSTAGSSASSSLRRPKEHLTEHPTIAFGQDIDVPVTTFDAYKAANGIERVDFLWLDMQGVEAEALKASPLTLAGAQVIHTEVSLKELYEGSMLYPEYRQFLENHGFVVVNEELFPDAGNVLFIKKSAL